MKPDVPGNSGRAKARYAPYCSPVGRDRLKKKWRYTYFASKDCHDTLAAHPLEPWARKDEEHCAIQCCGADRLRLRNS